jgi:hypothetical protein
MSQYQSQREHCQIGDLGFTYESIINQPIKPFQWFKTYRNVTLDSGEKIGQVSVEYNFTQNKQGSPSIMVYFESDDGDVHQLDESSIKALP